MISDARKWLKSRAETIPGIRAYPEPGQAFIFPCVVFDWAEPAADYLQAGDSARWTFEAYLLIQEGDPERGYESLDKYIDTTGESSVKYALEGDATNTTFDVTVKSCNMVGGDITYRGGKYYGASFTVEVYSPE